MPKILEMVPVLAFSQKVMIIFNLSLEREKKKKKKPVMWISKS